MPDEYTEALTRSFNELTDLLRKREQMDADLMRLRRFIRVTMNMLPPVSKAKFETRFELLTRNFQGLTEAVRDALKFAALNARGPGFVTAAQVRDLVMDGGFDFSAYKSNPLASVNTVLSRLKPREVETKTIHGVRAYRWKGLISPRDVKLKEASGSV